MTMNKMNKANVKGVAGMARKPAGFAKGGLVKSTGTINTGIKKC